MSRLARELALIIDRPIVEAFPVVNRRHHGILALRVGLVGAIPSGDNSFDANHPGLLTSPDRPLPLSRRRGSQPRKRNH